MTKQYINPEQWVFDGSEHYSGWLDHRGLLQINHPWEESIEGSYGRFLVDVLVDPALRDSKKVYLVLSQSDDYMGHVPGNNEWMGTQRFIGHRFKELHINGELIWESDVADNEMLTGPDGDYGGYDESIEFPLYSDPYLCLDVTKYIGDTITLSFTMVDRVASSIELPEDDFHRFAWSETTPEYARPRFKTNCYTGDFVLTDDPTFRPDISKCISETPVNDLSNSSIPLPELDLVMTSGLPGPGFPVRCGIPLPMGWLRDETKLQLVDPDGNAIPAAFEVTSRWKDGSIRWVLCEYPAKKQGKYSLAKSDVSSTDPDIKINEPLRELSNGLLNVEFGEPGESDILRGIEYGGSSFTGSLQFKIRMSAGGELRPYLGVIRSIELEKQNRVCYVAKLTGDMVDENSTRFGPWTARIELWEDLPYLIVDWDLINESDQYVADLFDWSAVFQLKDFVRGKLDFGEFKETSLEVHRMDTAFLSRAAQPARIPDLRAVEWMPNSYVLCRQLDENFAKINRGRPIVGFTEKAPGFARITKDNRCIAASTMWFAEQYPKGYQFIRDEMQICVTPNPEDVAGWLHDCPHIRIGRGEAKRQRFALWFADSISSEDVEKFNTCVQDQPVLYSKAWFGYTQALETGAGDGHSRTEVFEKILDDECAFTGYKLPRYGHREYLDTAWINNYRSRAHISLLRWVETGNPKWLRYFNATCRHSRDVDHIHFNPEHTDWVGATHEYSPDHATLGPMHHIGLNTDDLLEHYLLTGDRWSLDAATQIAEHVLKCEPYARSARAVGWPLAQVCNWYDHTGDTRFLDKAKAFVSAAISFTRPRRGIFDEIHGCWNYPGAVPFMTAYLFYGLTRYHRLTGCEKTGKLLRALSDGIIAECITRPGYTRYSPFPECNVPGTAASTNCWSVNLGGLHAYVYLHTGEEVYKQAMLDCYNAVKEDSSSVSMDMTQLYGWLLRGVNSSGEE
jgi:hypothetical protein